MSLPTDYNLPALHPNKYWLDVGTFIGDSIQLALDANCFEQIHGCDIDKKQIDFCFSRFDLANFPERLQLHHKNSVEFLQDMLPKLDAPATIFLDSHWQMTGEKPENAFPLMKELEVLMMADRTDHTIIIDDVLYMTHPDIVPWSLKQLKQAIRKINSRYKIELIANPVVNNMIICTV